MPQIPPLTPKLLRQAYANGYFPMAESADDPGYFWVYPESRGILPLEHFHVPRSLAKAVRRQPFHVTIDRDFPAVIAACAEPAPGPRQNTWINPLIRAAYTELHRQGWVHSVECRDASGALMGGLYGVRIGAAFFGESMFSRATDASKIALVHLVARLKSGGFRLLDSQFLTAHLARFGAVEVPRAEYLIQLQDAVLRDADFHRLPEALGPEEILRLVT